MKSFGRLLFALAAATGASAQFVGFEADRSGTPFPPLAGPPNAEGVVAETFNGGAAVTLSFPALGMPTQGGKYALLQAGIYVLHPTGVPVARPLPSGATELRIPVPTGSTFVAFDWIWCNEQGFNDPNNDGFDFSICDAAGSRLVQCAWGDTGAYWYGPTPLTHFSASTPPTPAGAYLSCAVFDGTDVCCGVNALAVDDVRFAHERVDFEAQSTTAPLPPFGVYTDCEELTCASIVVVSDGALCGLPVSGTKFCALYASTVINHAPQSQISRPLPAGTSELRIRIPAGSRTVSFAYAWLNLEGASAVNNDGFDASICDAAGQRLFACVYGDTYDLPAPYNGPLRYRGTFDPVPTGAYLSVAVYNGGDPLSGASTFGVDDVSFASRPMISLTSPAGTGTITIALRDGVPGGAFFMPATSVAGRYPDGAFFGLDMTVADILTEMVAGPPFTGVFDADGKYVYGPAPLLSGFEIFAVPLDTLFGPVVRVGDLVRYVVP